MNLPQITPKQVTSWLWVVLLGFCVLTIMALAGAVVFWAWMSVA